MPNENTVDTSSPSAAHAALDDWSNSEEPLAAGAEEETEQEATGEEEESVGTAAEKAVAKRTDKKAAAAKQKKLFKAMVNGREELVDLDDESVAKLNAVQTMKASQQAFREAAKLRKEAEQVQAAIKAAREQASTNPMAIFKALGMDEAAIVNFSRNVVYERMAEQIDPQTGQPYTPEQMRIMELQRTLKQKELTEKEQKELAENQEREAVMETVRRQMDKDFTDALQATGLPPTQYTMMRLADLMESVGPDVDPRQLAPLVMEDLTNESARTIAAMPIEAAAKILGKKFMDQLRKYDFDKAKGSQQGTRDNPQRFKNNASLRTPSRSKRTTNPKEAEDALERWANGG